MGAAQCANGKVTMGIWWEDDFSWGPPHYKVLVEAAPRSSSSARLGTPSGGPWGSQDLGPPLTQVIVKLFTVQGGARGASLLGG